METTDQALQEAAEAPAEKNATSSKNAKVRTYLGGSLLLLALTFVSSLLATIAGHHITHDLKHKHEAHTADGTQVAMLKNGDYITVSETHYIPTEKKVICSVLQGGVVFSEYLARRLGNLFAFTVAYQDDDETARHLLHLRVGSIKYSNYSLTDDAEDYEAIIG